MLSGEELLAGGRLDFEVEIPAAILNPKAELEVQGFNKLIDKHNAEKNKSGKVRIKPLSVHDLQLITRAAKSNGSLMASLMVQRALLEPELSISDVNNMHVGLLQFLLDKINALSGISATSEELQKAAEAPIAKAAFVLAREFGWTPQQVGDLTLGQVLLNLQMLKESDRVEA